VTRFILSPRARQDIDEIWRYTAKRWGASQAERYLRQLQAAFEAIGANPALGRFCEHIRAGYRKFPSGTHLLFYRGRKSGVEIVRVLHARMDVDRRLES
jgi:toxin ParE1/3/4